MSLFAELKRRNVFRVGIAYAVTSWLLIQVTDILFESIGAPPWVMQTMFVALAAGLVIALFFAWAFELTAEGVKKEKDVDRSASISPQTGQKLNLGIVALLVVTLAYVAYDKLVLDGLLENSPTVAGLGSEPFSQQTAGQSTQAMEKRTLTPIEAIAEPAINLQSIAVLPFLNMSEDGANEYFSDGLSEELLNLLAKIPELKVAARTSSFHFKNRTGDIAVIAAQLKVANILEGSVRKAGNQVRITAQLIKADDGYHLWSESYDRTLENIFEVQDEIATAVVEALKITLLGEAPVVAQVNPEAYALFLKGRYLSANMNEQNSHKAIEAYQAALDIDPEYAAAWASLARTLVTQTGFEYIEYDAGLAKALDAAQKAIELDAGLALAWSGLSDVQVLQWDWKAAYRSIQKAMELEPNNIDVLTQNAAVLAVMGLVGQGLSSSQRAVELDPLNLAAIDQLANLYYASGRFEKAEQQYLHLLSLNSNYFTAHHNYGSMLLTLGRYEEALAQAQADPDEIYRSLLTSISLFSLGRQPEANAELERFIENYQAFWAYQVAEAYSWRNEPDNAFQWLEAAIEYRDPGLSNILTEALFTNIHSDPRWEPFLAKMDLLDAWREMPDEYKAPGR